MADYGTQPTTSGDVKGLQSPKALKVKIKKGTGQAIIDHAMSKPK